MNVFDLALRSLRQHRGAALGAALGVVVATAVLVGALIAGDSIRHTLVTFASQRLGDTVYVMHTPDRSFSMHLAAGRQAPVLFRPGFASTPDDTRRANAVQVLGVDARFWKLVAPHGAAPPPRKS